MDNQVSQIAMGCGSIALLLICLAFGRRFIMKDTRGDLAIRRYRVFQDAVTRMAWRRDAIKSSAIAYRASIGKEGLREHCQLEITLFKAEQLANAVEKLLKDGNAMAQDEALLLLCYQYHSVLWACTDVSSSFPEADWERRCDNLLQSLERRIAIAEGVQDNCRN